MRGRVDVRISFLRTCARKRAHVPSVYSEQDKTSFQGYIKKINGILILFSDTSQYKSEGR